MGKVPDWVISQRRAQGLCEICGQQPAATVWAGTGQEICFDCCEGKRLANLPEADREAFMDRVQAEDRGPGRGSANTRGAGSGAADWPGTVNDGVEAAAARERCPTQPPEGRPPCVGTSPVAPPTGLTR